MTMIKQKGTENTTGWKECHEGNILVFTTHDGIEVYAGGSSRKGGWWLMNPVPELAMGPDNEVLKGMPSKYATRGLDADKWSCMGKIETVEPKNILAIDFPDYKTPQDLGIDFWMELRKNIRKNKIKTIHCMCMGGHGRTGVQLAILRWLLASEEERKAWKDANELVTAIRKPYCHKAVESKAQQEYVGDITGLPDGDPLPFHKYGGTTTYTKYNVKKTNFNIKLVECTVCDFVSWEEGDGLIEVGEWCYDLKCQGKLVDVSPYVIKRDKASLATDSCLCLQCLQPISDIQIMSTNHLSAALMEMMHGGDWVGLLTSQMALNSGNTCKGALLRKLAEIIISPEMDTDILVVDSCNLCSLSMLDNSDAPDYEKGDKGFVCHVKCDYCFKKVTPHILTQARDVNNNTTLKACPECINGNGNHKFFFTNNLKKADGQIVNGISPQHWFRLTNRTGWPDGDAEVVDAGKKKSNDNNEDFGDYHVV